MQSIGARFAHGLITLDEAAEHGLPRLRHAGRRLPVPRARPRRRRWWPRRSGWRCRTARSARRASRSGSTWRGARRSRWCAWRRSGIAARGDPDAARARERDAACTPRSAARPTCCCTSRRSRTPRACAPPDGRRLEARQPRDAAARRRAAERAARPPDRAGVHGRRRAGGDAAPARHGAAQPGRAHRHRARRSATVLDWWEASERRAAARDRLREADGVDPGPRDHERRRRAPRRASTQHGGASRSATSRPRARWSRPRPSIRPSSDDDDVYRHRGPARVFTSERGRRSPRSRGSGRARRCRPGDVIVLIGAGPLGTGWRRPTSSRRRSSTCPWGKTRRDRDRRALLRRVDRRVHRARRARGAGRRARSASCATATSIEIVIDRRHGERARQPGGRRRTAISRRTRRRALLARARPAPRPARPPGSARRHAPVGGAAAGERRHVGGLRLRRRSDRRGDRGGPRGDRRETRAEVASSRRARRRGPEEHRETGDDHRLHAGSGMVAAVTTDASPDALTRIPAKHNRSKSIVAFARASASSTSCASFPE